MRSRLALLAVLTLSSACSDWRARVTPGLAVDEPVQSPVEALPTQLTFADTAAVLTARARYSIKAWVVAVDDDLDDPFAEVIPLDVSLAWGPLGSPDILRSMSFHLKRRYVSARWDGSMPLAKNAVMEHLANHHLIGSTPELTEQLAEVKPGDLLTLEGYLVDVEVGRHKMRTSLRRTDVGNGACEILYVDRAQVLTTVDPP